MENIEKMKSEIIEALGQINPEQIILFGSFARGDFCENSDIDLYVVTSDDFIPKNFNEKINLKLKVARAVDVLRGKYPVDLIVHTKPMSEMFFKNNSLFACEIRKNGVTLK